MLAEAVARGKPLAGECPSGCVCRHRWEDGHGPLGPADPAIIQGLWSSGGDVFILEIWPWPLPGFRVLGGPYLRGSL